MRAGPLKTLEMTSSRSDVRSAVVSLPAVAGSLRAFTDDLLPVQFLDDLVQLVETGRPELAVTLDPRRLLFEPAGTQPAGSHPPHLLGDHEARMLQHADVLLHAGQRHSERVRELGDRGVLPREPLEHATPGRIGQCGKGRVDLLRIILNHMVQYRPNARARQEGSEDRSRSG